MDAAPQYQTVPGADRPCVGLAIPPGGAGLEMLMPPLLSAIEGTGPAICLMPGSGSAAYRAMVQSAVAPGEPVADEVAVVTATSGSTGNPAGVLLPGTALRAAARAFSDRAGQPDGHRWVCALPLHHAGGLMVAVRAAVAGATPVAVSSLGGASRFSVDAFAEATKTASDLRVHDQRPLAVSLVPPMLALLDAAGTFGVELLAEYDAVIVGGAPASPQLLRRMLDAGVPVVASYGMTETCGGAAIDGLPLDGITIEAEADGRLVISGEQVALGYRDGREMDRWSVGSDGLRRVRTDDLGTVAHDGTVTVTGRVDDVVQVAGTSVSLSAIREVLLEDPHISAAEVLALPDPTWSSHLVAAVVPRFAGRVRWQQATTDELTAAVREALGDAARPREIHVVPSLPMMASGKVDRKALHDWAAGLSRVRA